MEPVAPIHSRELVANVVATVRAVDPAPPPQVCSAQEVGQVIAEGPTVQREQGEIVDAAVEGQAVAAAIMRVDESPQEMPMGRLLLASLQLDKFLEFDHVEPSGAPHVAQVTAQFDQLTVDPRIEATLDPVGHEDSGSVGHVEFEQEDYFQVSLSACEEDGAAEVQAEGGNHEASSGLRLAATLQDVDELHGNQPPEESLAGLTLQEMQAYGKMKAFCARIVQTLAPPLLKEIQASNLRADAPPFTPRRSAHVMSVPAAGKSTKCRKAENVLIRALGLVPDDLQVDDEAVQELHKLLGSPL